MKNCLSIVVFIISLGASACIDDPKLDPPNGTILAEADQGFFDLDLRQTANPTAVDACYSLLVTTGEGEPYVGRGPGAVSGFPDLRGSSLNTLCSSVFGHTASLDISYVVPCDSAAPVHTIRYWVDALCAKPVTDLQGKPSWAGGPSTICEEVPGYVNPCGAEGCTVEATCEKNADTAVKIEIDTTAVAR